MRCNAWCAKVPGRSSCCLWISKYFRLAWALSEIQIRPMPAGSCLNCMPTTPARLPLRVLNSSTYCMTWSGMQRRSAPRTARRFDRKGQNRLPMPCISGWYCKEARFPTAWPPQKRWTTASALKIPCNPHECWVFRVIVDTQNSQNLFQ